MTVYDQSDKFLDENYFVLYYIRFCSIIEIRMPKVLLYYENHGMKPAH